ncbi:hypothetical protein GOC14_06805 [Sinorhizobium meliloti]|nr:hypothetical protein [Sinorhizobium meliloti]
MANLAQNLGVARTFPPRTPSVTPEARDIIARGIAARFIAWSRKRPVEEIVADRYGGNHLVLRAAVNPAMTNVPDWAGNLVGDAIGPFMALAPSSAYAQLAARGTRVSFGTSGNIVVPQDTLSTPIEGMFVGEGAPIPVVNSNLSAAMLQPRKAAAIVSWTREMAKATPLTIAAIFATLLEHYVGFRADQILLGSGAASETQPAGIANGVTPITPAATGAPLDRMVADLRNLVEALVEDAGPIEPVFVMSQANKIAVDLLSPGHGLDIIASPTLAFGSQHRVIALDAASFVSAEGDNAEIEFGEEATLHMEDTAPLPIVDAAGVTASPVRSLWQTASVGLRMINSLDWVMRRPGRVAEVQENWFGA